MEFKPLNEAPPFPRYDPLSRAEANELPLRNRNVKVSDRRLTVSLN